MEKYILRIDIIENNGLTNTYYGERERNIEDSRYAAQEIRERLFENRSYGEIKDYTVDIVPRNR